MAVQQIKGSTYLQREIFLDIANAYTLPCAGCGAVIPEGTQFLGGINSCCGGCYVHLCANCVEYGHRIMSTVESVLTT